MYFGEPFGGLIPGAQGAVLAALLRTDAPLTGRQVYSLVRSYHSLWSVQEALKTLARLGLVESRAVGRAHIHSIKESHYAVAYLRALLNPVEQLRSTISRNIDSHVQSVMLFGSLALGQAHRDSDIDLAVVADEAWDGRLRLEEAVQESLGNECDVLVFTPSQFEALARDGEPVVAAIIEEGIALFGERLV